MSDTHPFISAEPISSTATTFSDPGFNNYISLHIRNICPASVHTHSRIHRNS